jgi:hypothetical protein
MACRVVLVALALSASVFGQQAPPAKRPDDAKIDAAIRRGVEFLKGTGGRSVRGNQAHELVLLALVHAGVRPNDPFFAALLQGMLEDPLQMTYRVALQAMVLEEIDRVKYQRRIFQCAQYLVDNQCQNGQWSYGQPTTFPDPNLTSMKDVATGSSGIKPGQVVMFGEPEYHGKPIVRQKIPVKKQREGPPAGDNSNAQYAALGLRACHDSGIVLPTQVVERAQKWWRECQCNAGAQGGGVVSGQGSRGWSYHDRGDSPYGSMTAGAVAALTICDYILGADWKKDETLAAGVGWLSNNFNVLENPGRKGGHLYYYLYGLERAGMLYGTETFGKRDWYAEGANTLLQNQAADGQWNGTIDTCFAILFLRRATRALVESKDQKK